MKTIEEWSDELKITILDPDGFDRTDSLLYQRLFSKEQFLRGAYKSTTNAPLDAFFDVRNVGDGIKDQKALPFVRQKKEYVLNGVVYGTISELEDDMMGFAYETAEPSGYHQNLEFFKLHFKMERI